MAVRMRKVLSSSKSLRFFGQRFDRAVIELKKKKKKNAGGLGMRISCVTFIQRSSFSSQAG